MDNIDKDFLKTFSEVDSFKIFKKENLQVLIYDFKLGVEDFEMYFKTKDYNKVKIVETRTNFPYIFDQLLEIIKYKIEKNYPKDWVLPVQAEIAYSEENNFYYFNTSI